MLGRAIPLAYVREALGPNEKIVRIGRFHWFYDVVSWFYLAVCVALGIGLLVAVSYYIVYVDTPKVQGAFPGISPDAAYVKLMDHYGGWIGLVRDVHIIPKLVACLFVLFGIYLFVSRMVIKYTTEIAITTQRLIYKKGVIARAVGEMKLDRLEGINVWQSFFGRIFNYGRISVHGVGVGHVVLPEMEEPMKFRKALDYARNKFDEAREERMEEIRDRVDERREGRIDRGEIPVDN